MLYFYNLNKVLKYFIFIILVHKSKADYYTSIVGLEKLLQLENELIKAAEQYIINVEEIQKEIERFLIETELEHKKSKKDPNNYYGEPTNAFKIIKRMEVDWKRYGNLIIMEPEFQVYNKSIEQLQSKYDIPTEDDLEGAAIGLIALQDLYSLETKQLAEGYILNNKYSKSMRAHDSYILAETLYDASEYVYASEWFSQTLHLLDNVMDESEDSKLVASYPFVSYMDVLKNFAISLFYADNFKMAKLVFQQLLEVDPTNKDVLESKKIIDNSAVEERRLVHIYPKSNKSELETLYHQVCNGELTQSVAELRPLRCRYFTNNIAFYFIGPIKMEELSLDPFVAVYYQTIYDNEINQIIEAAEDDLQRSKIGVENSADISDIRTSKEAWLFEEPFLVKLRQRLEDITGLSIEYAEDLQVVNYGIGGHYEPHYDFSLETEEDYKEEENRILTALFYISDVDFGGSTAFPFLRLNISPIKYSLLVWYNMHNTTEVDYRTVHAGCPVLKGSKWIVTERFQVKGQEFKRPCGLQPVDDKYNHYYDITLL